jgi:amino acid transporter
MGFKKEISPFNLLLTAIGGIVGSGWLFGPLYAAQDAGPASILSWVIGGVLMMIIALTFAELGASIPKAGGMVRFAQFSHGTLVSFTMAWISWLAAVMVAPIETMAALQYAANYYPWLTQTMNDTVSLTPIGVGVATLVMMLMSALNLFSVKIFAKSNALIVTWKLIVPVITIGFLFYLQFNSDNFSHFGGFAPSGLHGILYALPNSGVIFSFIGYSSAIQLAAETRNPSRAIPFAILGAIGACIIMYVLLQIAFIGAINSDMLHDGWAKLHFNGDHGPIAGLLTGLGLGWFVTFLYADAIISPLGTGYIYTAGTARTNYAMSRNGYMPIAMEYLNKSGAPVKAIVTNFAVGMLFFFFFSGWQAMLGFLVSCFTLAFAIGPLACVCLREHLPDLPRPFKVPFYRVSCSIAFYICNLMMYWSTWDKVWKVMVVILIGFGVLGLERRVRQTEEPLHAEHLFWLVPYLGGLTLISYLGCFGGKGYLPFGWDFAVIFAFSVLIFEIATRFRPTLSAISD